MDDYKKMDGFDLQRLLVLPEDITNICSENELTNKAYITDIGYFPNAMFHYRERPEGCDSYILIYCCKGEGYYSVGGKEPDEVKKGDVFLIPAFTPHYYGADLKNPWSIYWIHLKGNLVKSFFSELTEDIPISMKADYMTKFIDLFESCYTYLEKWYNTSGLVYVSQAAGHIMGLLFMCAKQSEITSNNKTDIAIKDSIQYMLDNITKNILLSELSVLTNFSISYFSSVFKKATSFSPIDYFLRLKIQTACKYLSLTDYSIKEVSLNIGIQDQYYFSRLFKKVMGVSPKKYRETVKG